MVIDMNIQEMISVSYFLLIMAGIFAVTVVILFFWYDIPKCMRMVCVKGGRHGYRKKRYTAKAVIAEAGDSVRKKPQITTERMDAAEMMTGDETMLPLCGIDQTQLIGGDEMLRMHKECAETQRIDTNQLELIQDIVKMQRKNEVTVQAGH